MRKPLLATLVVLAVPFAQPGMATDSHPGHAVQHAAPAAALRIPLSDGLVKKVDPASGRVTVAHGPLPNGMPPMTMPMKVRDAAWLGKLQAGQKIRFAAAEVDGVLTIVRLELPGQ